MIFMVLNKDPANTYNSQKSLIKVYTLIWPNYINYIQGVIQDFKVGGGLKVTRRCQLYFQYTLLA